MMRDGLHNQVNIYNLSDVGTGMLNHDRVLDTAPKYKDISCRIIKDEKVLFEQDILIRQGDVLYDVKTKRQHNIKEVKRVNGLNGFHHLSCKVELRRVGDLDGRQSQHTSGSSRLTKLD